MKSYSDMEFHPDSEHLVRILCEKTQNSDPLFFRVLVAYYFALVASSMRTTIKTMDRGVLPVNLYAINLSVSGAGKGHSMNVMEDQVLNQFRHNFLEQTLQEMAETNLPKIANQRAIRKQSDPDKELEQIFNEYENLGPLLFSFDSATGPAIKDTRHKLLLADGGALNLQIDEIGYNLTAVAEALGPYLEMYDVGKIKQKLTKNTNDNKRREEIHGRTPANMLAFGTPTRLLNGSKTEEEFMALLDTGYARRCFFGYCRDHNRKLDLTPQEILDQRIQGNSDQFLQDFSDKLGDIADISNAHAILGVSKEVTLIFIEYEQNCIRKAQTYGDHDELRKAELSHRYFKALKLAGAYAFIDMSPEITEDHAYAAIKLAEESGAAFDQLLTRDRPYVKLARYIAEVGRPVTQADLLQDLPFYKGSVQQRADMMLLAIAYGYQNNIVIKKEFMDGVEFVHGETLEETNLDQMTVSYSTDLAQGYHADLAPFDRLHELTNSEDMHWCAHHFIGGHRLEDKVIPGFNLLVLDCDGTVQLSTAKLLLKDYKALFYTTKRDQPDCNRFRIILPMNYKLELDNKEHKEFWKNIFAWLPFEVDEGSNQRARKWLSHNGHFEYQDGELIDVLPFIPKTSKNEEFKNQVLDQQGMDNLERWIIRNTGDGNRNNMLLKFAMILVDAGFEFDPVLKRVNSLNEKLADKLDESEILSTIMKTAAKAIANR